MRIITDFRVSEGFLLFVPNMRTLRRVARIFREKLVFDHKSNQYWINREDEGAQLCFVATENGYKLVFVNCHGESSERQLDLILKLLSEFKGSMEIVVTWDDCDVKSITVEKGQTVKRFSLFNEEEAERYEDENKFVLDHSPFDPDEESKPLSGDEDHEIEWLTEQEEAEAEKGDLLDDPKDNDGLDSYDEDFFKEEATGTF